jgi:hypothetical protein
MQNRQTEVDRFKQLTAVTPAAERSKLVEKAPSFLCLIIMAPTQSVLEANHRAAAYLAGTQLLLALRRYQVVHGRLPDDLPAAARESLLKTVPIDPSDGQAMRFAVVAGKPTVYSVGRDGKDDGGALDWKFGQQPGDFLFVLPPLTP